MATKPHSFQVVRIGPGESARVPIVVGPKGRALLYCSTPFAIEDRLYCAGVPHALPDARLPPTGAVVEPRGENGARLVVTWL